MSATSPGLFRRFKDALLGGATRTRRLATLQAQADAAGEDVRTLLRVGDAFRDECEPLFAVKVYWRAVHVHRRNEEHLKSLALLKRVVALVPQDVTARTALAECLETLDRRAESADHFRAASKLAFGAGRPNAARALFDRAERLCPLPKVSKAQARTAPTPPPPPVFDPNARAEAHTTTSRPETPSIQSWEAAETAHYTPMLLDELLEEERPTVAVAPSSPLRRAS